MTSLAYILAALSALAGEPVSYSEALADAARCETPTAWAEQVPGGWVPMCGDSDGAALGGPDGRREAAWDLAMAMGDEMGADAAWEDAFQGVE